MDTTRLLQTLEVKHLHDIVQYYIIIEFLNHKTLKTFLEMIKLLDRELNQDPHLSVEQKKCIQYLYRDWGYEHLKKEITPLQKKHIFTIDGVQQTSGHFIEAVDFSKRNPKDNILLMRFSLSLLIHSAQPNNNTATKINALDQLLPDSDNTFNYLHLSDTFHEKKVFFLIIYSATLLLYSIWMLTKITMPKL